MLAVRLKNDIDNDYSKAHDKTCGRRATALSRLNKSVFSWMPVDAQHHINARHAVTQPSLQDSVCFVIAEINEKPNSIWRRLQRWFIYLFIYHRFSADSGQDASCEVVKMHVQPKPSPIYACRTRVQLKGLLYQQKPCKTISCSFTNSSTKKKPQRNRAFRAATITNKNSTKSCTDW